MEPTAGSHVISSAPNTESTGYSTVSQDQEVTSASGRTDQANGNTTAVVTPTTANGGGVTTRTQHTTPRATSSPIIVQNVLSMSNTYNRAFTEAYKNTSSQEY